MKHNNMKVLLLCVVLIVSLSFGYFVGEVIKRTAYDRPQTTEKIWTDELRQALVADCMNTPGRTERYCNCMVEQVDNYPLESVIAEVHENSEGGEIISTAESVCLPQ